MFSFKARDLFLWACRHFHDQAMWASDDPLLLSTTKRPMPTSYRPLPALTQLLCKDSVSPCSTLCCCLSSPHILGIVTFVGKSQTRSLWFYRTALTALEIGLKRDTVSLIARLVSLVHMTRLVKAVTLERTSTSTRMQQIPRISWYRSPLRIGSTWSSMAKQHKSAASLHFQYP